MIRARVITEHKASYILSYEGGVIDATVRGSFHDGENAVFPKVGDYVACTILPDGKGVIESIEPRISEVCRKSAHDDSVQVMVTNIDYIFIVMGLDEDFNVRRLERYLVLAAQSHVQAVVVLNKMDVATAYSDQVAAVEAVTEGVPVYSVSAKTGEGMEVFAEYLTEGKTGVLLGSSGAGKSTITNHLLESQTQETQGLRAGDGRGRHTTTTRELFPVDSGGYLIDTPGMRELGFVSEEEMDAGTFADIESLTHDCKFSNCDHVKSAGCAVQAAIERGEIDQKHFENYRKLHERKAETRSTRRRD